MRTRILWGTVVIFGLAGAGLAARALDSDAPKHAVPQATHGGTMVVLCDGQTSYELPVAPGQPVPQAEAKKAADTLMADWRRTHPGASWDDQPVLVAANDETSSSGAKEVPAEKQANTQSGTTYGSFSARDRAIWEASTAAFVDEGKHIFHDVKDLGGTTGISCDMCHPDAANTHPETYPKYQVQLGRVALLRDMINWCIENPVRGKPLPEGDRKLKALEAYIYAQRKGVALNYGTH